MAYERTIWKNREVENPRTFVMQQNPDGTITLIPSEGTIIEPGTPIIASIMNNIEDGIEYAIEQGGKVKSVNNKTGDVVLSSSDVGAVPTSRKVNGKALSADVSLTTSDVGAVPTSRTVNGKSLNANISLEMKDIYNENNNKVFVGNYICLGPDATISNLDSNGGVCIGQKANVDSAGIAIGTNAKTRMGGVSIGGNTNSIGDGIAIGWSASAEGYQSVALGPYSKSPNDQEGVLGGKGGLSPNIWKVPGSFTVSGTKNFEIPHPCPDKKATHMLRHAAVESPTAGDTLYRYTITATENNQTVEMQLPDYFQYLNKNVDVWVNGYRHFGRAFGEVEGDILKVTCELAGEYNVLVIGTRNDDHPSVQEWDIKGVEREIGESWTGETYAFEVDEIIEVEEIKEVA